MMMTTPSHHIPTLQITAMARHKVRVAMASESVGDMWDYGGGGRRSWSAVRRIVFKPLRRSHSQTPSQMYDEFQKIGFSKNKSGNMMNVIYLLEIS